jgi:hypothetical protein
MLDQEVLIVNGMEWNYGSYVTCCSFFKVGIVSYVSHMISRYRELEKYLVTFASNNAMLHGF